MSSSNQKGSHPRELNLIFFSIPQNILLQISVGPVLLAVLGGRAAAQLLQTLGEESEEIFRGERLPILNFPLETEPDSSSDC